MAIQGLICAIALSITIAEATEHPAQVAGIYEGTVAVKGADGRRVTLLLEQDGHGEFRNGTARTPGQWSATDSEIRMEFGGKKPAMIWRVKGNSLAPREWDRKEFGKRGLVLRRPR